MEVLELSYDQLNELLSQSEVTREALRQAAEAHEQENSGAGRRGLRWA